MQGEEAQDDVRRAVVLERALVTVRLVAALDG